MMIARAVTWLTMLSIDPKMETRRGTLSVFSDLQAAYSSEPTLHALLYFHHHEDKQLLENRVRGAMHDLEDRLAKVAVTPASNVIAKRQKVIKYERILRCFARSSPDGPPCIRTHCNDYRPEIANR